MVSKIIYVLILFVYLIANSGCSNPGRMTTLATNATAPVTSNQQNAFACAPNGKISILSPAFMTGAAPQATLGQQVIYQIDMGCPGTYNLFHKGQTVGTFAQTTIYTASYSSLGAVAETFDVSSANGVWVTLTPPSFTVVADPSQSIAGCSLVANPSVLTVQAGEDPSFSLSITGGVNSSTVNCGPIHFVSLQVVGSNGQAVQTSFTPPVSNTVPMQFSLGIHALGVFTVNVTIQSANSASVSTTLAAQVSANPAPTCRVKPLSAPPYYVGIPIPIGLDSSIPIASLVIAGTPVPDINQLGAFVPHAPGTAPFPDVVAKMTDGSTVKCDSASVTVTDPGVPSCALLADTDRVYLGSPITLTLRPQATGIVLNSRIDSASTALLGPAGGQAVITPTSSGTAVGTVYGPTGFFQCKFDYKVLTTQSFPFPTVPNGTKTYVIENCSQPAMDKFCSDQGFLRAKSFNIVGGIVSDAGFPSTCDVHLGPDGNWAFNANCDNRSSQLCKDTVCERYL